jgi:hypothetical protein
MRLLFSIIIALVAFRTSSSQDLKVSLVIEQVNIITGKAVMYNYNDSKVRTYKKTTSDNYVQTSSNKIAKVKADSINMLATALLEKYQPSDSVFSNSRILDGYKWTVIINSAEIKREFKVYNCYHKQLDDFVRIINGEIKKRNRLIFPSGWLYKR